MTHPAGFPAHLPFSFSYGSETQSVINVRAKTHCEGGRIDLSWSDTGGVYKVKRSRRTFSIVLDDDPELIYTGSSNSLSDTNLEENTIYYYTVYYSLDAGATYLVDDGCRVAGLSIRDYASDEGAHWLYEYLPGRVKQDDATLGVDQYTLRRLMDVLQCGVALFRGYIEAYESLTNADKMPAGRVGDSANQHALLENLNIEMGFDPQRALGVEVMRRVALGITKVRRKKGMCPGLVEFVKLLTGWDGDCVPVSDGSCGGGYLLRTWDGVSALVRGSGAAATIDNTAGQLTDSAAAFDVDRYANGVLFDGMGQLICIKSNTATKLVFEDAAAQARFEDEYLVDAGYSFSGFGTTTFVITQPTGRKPFNTGMYNGMYIKFLHAADTGRVGIVSCTASSDGLTLTLDLDGFSPASASRVAVARDYVDEPLTYANRHPLMKYVAYDGEHYRIWEPLFDERLRGTLDDPFDVLWSGSLLSGVPFSDGDVVFWVAAGVAQKLGKVTTLTDDVLTSDVALTPSAFVGMYLNPNRNQNKFFKIIANDATTITVSGGNMTQIATSSPSSSYVVLKPMDVYRYQAVYNTVRRFLPYQTRLFLWFQ